MVRIRLNGTLDEIQRVADDLREIYIIQSRSMPYRDRGDSRNFRMYLECERLEKSCSEAQA